RSSSSCNMSMSFRSLALAGLAALSLAACSTTGESLSGVGVGAVAGGRGRACGRRGWGRSGRGDGSCDCEGHGRPASPLLSPLPSLSSLLSLSVIAAAGHCAALFDYSDRRSAPCLH